MRNRVAVMVNVYQKYGFVMVKKNVQMVPMRNHAVITYFICDGNKKKL